MKKLLFLLMSVAVLSASAGITKSPLQKNVAKIERNKVKTELVSPFKMNRVIDNQVLRAPITEQPEGEVRTYLRSGDCLYVPGQYIEHGTQDGYIELIFAADNKVWFKNIFYLCGSTYGNSYVYGTLSEDGTKITVPMGQSIYYSTSYQADVVLSYGTSSVGSSIVWTPDESVTEVVYAIDGNTITLEGCAGATPSGSDYPQYEYTGLGSVWTDDGTFGGFLEWETVFTFAVIPQIPQNLAVEPGVTTADVTWASDENAEGWDLRYRPYVDTSGSPINITLPADGYESQLDGISILDADGDGEGWDITAVDEEETDLCFYSISYYQGTAYDADNWLIMPLHKLEGDLRFKAWSLTSQWPDDIQIMIGKEDAIEGNTVYTDMFETIATYTCDSEEPQEYYIDLSEYNGELGYVVFRHQNYNQYVLFLDDIFIGDPNAEVVVPYEWTIIPALETNECTIPGLTPETTYEVQAMAYNGDIETDWCGSVIFTTLPEPVIPDVYMLGGSGQTWDPTSGTKFDYNAEDNIYTKTITFPDENNYFGFTTKLAENNDDGGWAYIEPFRFGAVSVGNFDYLDEYNGLPIDLTWDAYQSIHIAGGEYNLTVDLTSMKLIIVKVVPPHNYDKGDVNHDRAVNISDVTTLIDYLLGIGTVCEICADVNGDGPINISDVTALIDVLLGGSN
ncbi:MAG: choice-of-anchor J domain-containing protein [Muribaculaceae bacterium]|nr:choice-of-anchor J domain-containing protein [Muribaculaceae bacterium]